MEYTLAPASIPVRGQLEDRAAVAAAPAAAIVCRTVEITGCVEGQANPGIASVAAVKRMEDALGPASIPVRGQLEDRAAAAGAAGAPAAAKRSRAVEITGCV